MTDDLALDLETIDRQRLAARVPADAWVSRQIGCSDLAPLLVASFVFGRRDSLAIEVCNRLGPVERTWLMRAVDYAAWASGSANGAEPRVEAKWCAAKAAAVETPVGRVPQIVAVKAGARTREWQGALAAGGVRLEGELIRRWADLESTNDELARIVTQHEVVGMYPPAWRAKAPRIAHPSFDGLVTYPDAWGWTWNGELAVINAKTTYKPAASASPPYVIQMQGELAVTGAALGLLPHGQGWLSDYGSTPPEERPIETFRALPYAPLGEALVAFAREALAWISEVNAEWTSRKKDSQ